MKYNKIILSMLFISFLLFNIFYITHLTCEEARAVWVTRWDYKSASDIQTIIDRAKNANFNMVIFQVRGTFDALYNSNYEPWSALLTGTLGQDPGWDPLYEAVTRAHAAGLELHAWINTYPMWSGTTPPPHTTPEHMYNAHPEWLSCDTNGQPMQLGSGYVCASPGIPAVHDHIYNVVMDIVTRYNVDGIHFDYIRYYGPQYSHDPISVARFNDTSPTGGNPNNLSWGDWQREQITSFLRRIYENIAGPNGVKPSLKISASVWGIYKDIWNWGSSQGYYDYYQDSRKWLEEGIVDFVCPMIYWPINNPSGPWNFATLVADWGSSCQGYSRHVYAGMLADYSNFQELVDEINLSRNTNGIKGNAIFAYSTLTSRAYWDDLSASGGPYALPDTPPLMPWKINYSTGLITGNVYKVGSSQPIVNATVQAKRNGVLISSKLTDLNGRYSLVVGTGVYTLVALAQNYGSQSIDNISVLPNQTVTLNFYLQPIYGWIKGNVSEQSTGNKIVNANISLLQNNVVKYTVNTNLQGDYMIMVSSGYYDIKTFAYGYNPKWYYNVNLLPDTTSTLNFTLERSSSYYATGFWHIITSTHQYFNSYLSTTVWWYGQDTTGDYNNNTTNKGELVSPFYEKPTKYSKLTFYSWEETDNRTGTDKRIVYISTCNGIYWEKVFESTGPQQTWYKKEIDLSRYENKPILVKFYFDTVDDQYNNYRGWYLDSIHVSYLGGYVSGKITNENNQSLSYAKIKLVKNEPSGIEETYYADVDGNYNIFIPSGSWYIRASYLGYEYSDINNVVVEANKVTENVNFVLKVSTDITPPSKITDVTVIPSTFIVGGIEIKWTSTGDDGNIGEIINGQVQIKYSSSPLDTPFTAPGNFINQMDISPNVTYTTLITGLKPAVTYYIWLRISDEAINWSDFSNMVSTYAYYDSIPPGKITNLVATYGEQVTLTWTSPGENMYDGKLEPGIFEIVYSTLPINLNNVQNYDKIYISTITNPGTTFRYSITGLIPFVNYYFVIRTQDKYENWSEYSSIATAYSGLYYCVDKISVNGSIETFDTGDYNNDGYEDIVVATYYGPIIVFKNNGNGKFSVAWISPEQYQSSYYSICWCDYNNDGFLDIIIACDSLPTRVYLNMKNDNFVNIWSSSNNNRARTLAICDINNDGFLDIIVGNYSEPVRVYLNTKDHKFSLVWSSTETLRAYRIVPADFDNDGYIDFAVSASRQPNLTIYHNNKNNTFVAVSKINPGTTYSGLDLFDYNNDGKIDIVIAPYGGKLRVYKNNGNNVFTQVWYSTETVYCYGLQCVDFNNDGLSDILVSNYNLRSYVFLNNNSNSFVNIAPNIYKSAYDIKVIDIDNDSDLDFLQLEGTSIYIYKSQQQKIKENSTPLPPNGTFQTVYENNKISFYWNNGSDTETPVTGLFYNIRVGTTPQGCNLLTSTLKGKNLKPPYFSGVYQYVLNLNVQTTIYWSVQTVDNGFKVSPWSVENTFIPPVVYPATGVIKGTVYDNTMQPVNNAVINLYQAQQIVITTFTNNEGKYYVEITTGVYNIEVTKVGYNSVYLPNVVVSKSTPVVEINFTLLPSTSEIIQQPVVNSISISNILNNSTSTIYIYGQNFSTNTVIYLQYDDTIIYPIDKEINTSTISCTFDFFNLTPTEWVLKIIDEISNLVFFTTNVYTLADINKENFFYLSCNGTKIKLEFPLYTLNTEVYFKLNHGNQIMSIPYDELKQSAKLLEEDGFYPLTETIVEINVYDKNNDIIPSLSLYKNVYVYIPYKDDDNNGFVDNLDTTVNCKSLCMFFYQPTEKKWVKLDNSIVNLVNKNVSAPTNHLSIFMLAGKISAKNLKNVKVYPNPAKNTNCVNFTGLTQNAVVKIYNVAGELISILHNTDYDDKEIWQFDNISGRTVASGVYIFFVSDNKGNKTKGKFVVIK